MTRAPDGRTQGLEQAIRLLTPARQSTGESIDVDHATTRSQQPEFAQAAEEGAGQGITAAGGLRGGHGIRDLTGQSTSSPDESAIGNDRSADALTQVHMEHVIEGSRAA